MSPNRRESVSQRPVELLQSLIRFDTTNPPGNEDACIIYISNMLKEAGIQPTILARESSRPNLIARLPGQGHTPPLLLQGHVDVVTTAHQAWQHPPFEGRVVGGYVWGRGALDMKGGVAMMLAAFLRAKAANLALPGDVILAVLSDEEAGGNYGAKWLVENHAHLFKDVQYAIGEGGGFALHVGQRRFYPIMVAEKQICWMKATVRGPGGHGALILRGGAMAKLAQFLTKLDRHRLPVHITPVARQMFSGMAAASALPLRLMLRALLDPTLANKALDALGKKGELFDPLLHNTVNATIVRGGDKINVIPSEITIELDGRLLPGCTPIDMVNELRTVVGEDVDLEVVRHDAGPSTPQMALFGTLADVLRELDPAGISIPLLLAGVTDARFFSRLGIQTYGWLPQNLPAGFDFLKTIHGADERIPAEALDFGTEAIYRALQRFGQPGHH